MVQSKAVRESAQGNCHRNSREDPDVGFLWSKPGEFSGSLVYSTNLFHRFSSCTGVPSLWEPPLQLIKLRASCPRLPVWLPESSTGRMRRALTFVIVLLTLQLAMAGLLGGKKDLGNVHNDLEVEELAKYAVNQYNSQSNSIAPLSFSKVLSAKSQVVQGTMYHLTIEAHQGDQAKHWDARVWVKPWENFKKLEEFKAASPSASGDGARGGGDL